MHDLSRTYAHYGDRLRRKRKIRAALILCGFVGTSVAAAWDWRADPAQAAVVSKDSLSDSSGSAVDSGDSQWFAGEDLKKWTFSDEKSWKPRATPWFSVSPGEPYQ